MDEREIKIWYDSEGDYLEVIFGRTNGNVEYPKIRPESLIKCFKQS